VRLTHAMVAAAVSLSRAYGLATGHTVALAYGLHDAIGVVKLIAALHSGGYLVVPLAPVGDYVVAASTAPPTVGRLAAKYDADWSALHPSAAEGLAASPPIPTLWFVRVSRPGGAGVGGVGTAAGAPVLPAWCSPEAGGVGALVSSLGRSAGLRAPPELKIVAVLCGDDGTWAWAGPGEAGVVAVRRRSVAASRGAAATGVATDASAPFWLPDEAAALAADADAAGTDEEEEGSDGGSCGGPTLPSGPAVEAGCGLSVARMWMPTADRGSVDAA